LTLADRLSALTPEQRALFEKLRAGQPRSAAPQPPPVRPVSGPLGLGDWPLSFDQERLWQLHQENPRLISRNVDAGSYVSGELDLPRFAAALNELVSRHAAWRTTFPVVEGRPVQRVVRFLAPEITFIDLTRLPAELRERAGHQAIYHHTRVPFDLARGPLVRLALVRLAPREHLYLITLHHLVTDWIAFQIFFRELMVCYAALQGVQGVPGGVPPLPPLPVQYPDFALWERAWWQGEILAAEARFWQRELAGFPLCLELPADRPRPAVQSQRGGLYRMAAGAERSHRLRALARSEGATTFMVSLALLYALLWRFTGAERLIVGSNSANRVRPELEPVAGFFLTQVPFAGDLAGDPTFRELTARARKTALAAYAHQNFPFSRLIEALAPNGVDAGDRSRNPIIQALLLILEVQTPARVGELAFRPVELYDGNSRWDLMFGLYDDPELGLGGPLEYNADIFDAPTVGRLLELLYRLMDAVIADPDRRISSLPEMGDLAEIARCQVLAAPELADLPDPQPELVDRLLPVLQRLGAAVGARVGLLLRPSPLSAALTLALRRLGAAPIPIDPGEPEVRLAVLLADAGLALLLYQGDPPGLRTVGAVRKSVAEILEEAG